MSKQFGPAARRKQHPQRTNVRVWVLDVAGNRLIIDAWHMPGATDQQINTLTAMVDGLVMTIADAR